MPKKNKSRFWRIETETFVVEFDSPVGSVLVGQFLDNKRHPESLSSCGWSECGEPEDHCVTVVQATDLENE